MGKKKYGDRFFLFLIPGLFFMTLSSCTPRASKTVTEADNGIEVRLHQGDILGVKLKAQLSTGFSWQTTGLDKSLKQLGPPKQSPVEKDSAKTEMKTGRYEYQTFLFKALQKGKSELKMEYRKSWETDQGLLKSYSLNVIIE